MRSRQLIADGLKDLEKTGLSKLETFACDRFTDDALDFCNWAFTKHIETCTPPRNATRLRRSLHY